MTRRASVLIGTSGWHYKHWLGPFYPMNMRPEQFLSHYLHSFQTTEINNSFYRLPLASTFREWRDSVPEDFTFAVKASRFITHIKRLKDPKDSLRLFFSRLKNLKERTGPVLFQLPPRWNCDLPRLKAFLEALPENHRVTIEFRDPSWFNDEVYAALADHNVSLCFFDWKNELSPQKLTSDFVYVRFHGSLDRYSGDYTEEMLRDWAERIFEWRRMGKDVYCYFNNDAQGFAVKNALRLDQLVNGGRGLGGLPRQSRRDRLVAHI